jgi:hypothetical protein
MGEHGRAQAQSQARQLEKKKVQVVTTSQKS